MLEIKKFTVNAFQENSYLLISNKKAVIVDPGMSNPMEERKLNEVIIQKGLTLEAVWLTHAHIDHIMGLEFITKQYNVPVYYHSLEEENLWSGAKVANAYGVPFKPFKNINLIKLDRKRKLKLGQESFDILFTPGHSVGSVSFYNKNQNAIISGDVLFFQSIGRSDLPGGDYAILEKSIQEKLYKLPEETLVYSGHGPDTSIGFEKTTNPFVKAK